MGFATSKKKERMRCEAHDIEENKKMRREPRDLCAARGTRLEDDAVEKQRRHAWERILISGVGFRFNGRAKEAHFEKPGPKSGPGFSISTALFFVFFITLKPRVE